MNGERFDTLARTVAETRSRRAAVKVLGSITLGGILTVLGNRHAAVEAGKLPPAYPASGYLCNQLYALCTSAPCAPSESDPTTVVCRCLVENGYSYGYTSCAERVSGGNTLVSTFSLQNVTDQSRAMTCSVGGAGGIWANCLDVSCWTDPADSTQAVCQCPVIQTQQYITFGGGCDQTSCTSVIWSAATVDLPVINEYTSAMGQIGQPVPNLQNCPST